MISYCSSALNSSSSSIVGYFMSIPIKKLQHHNPARWGRILCRNQIHRRNSWGKRKWERKESQKCAPSGIRTRVSRLGSVNANHYTNSALKGSCPFGFSDSHGRPKTTCHQYSVDMGSGGKTKGKRQAHSSKREWKRMRAIKNRMKDLDQIQVNGSGKC